MKELVSLLPLIGIVAVFWLLVIRPASRRNKELALLQASVTVGDRVMLGSGFFGTVRAVHDDRLDIEIASGVVAQVVRGAVARVVSAPDSGEAS